MARTPSTAKSGNEKKKTRGATASVKIAALEPFRASPLGKTLTTNQGLPIADDDNSLRAGDRGPTLLEDFILREKITHFDHERIPERVVHARGAAAHGYFQCYESLADITTAAFLQDPSIRTPVFCRFSTVGGSRGSADTPRDVRGFAVKFYTSEGNYDLVGNNMPVFFIQDAIKFPDFIHAVKPEPHNEIPQASSAHDTLWDFVSLTLESSHMMMWLMSDRSLPRSFATMEGFGVHTFRMINAAGESRYVKFHWKPILGTHSLIWDEAQKLMGKDPDFNRRDMYERIDRGGTLEWELGIQLFGDKEADGFPFDILDSTKLIPEELVPVRRIGKMVLDRNPDSYFAETEQVAFCTTHLVPGIGFTNDPLLQGRNFSYLDTQISRLGGPNFHEIPINRPVCPFSNGQRDGLHRMRIDTGDAAYSPNSLDEHFPVMKPVEEGGFGTFPEPVEGVARRIRADSFNDYFSQATMFWNSMSPIEKEHITTAFSFELAQVNRPEIRQRVLEQMLANIDTELAAAVAANLGLPAPVANTNDSPAARVNGHVGTNGSRNGNGKSVKKAAKRPEGIASSPLLSQLNPATGVRGDITGRNIAIVVAKGSLASEVVAMQAALAKRGAIGLVIGATLGTIEGEDGPITVDHTSLTKPSVVFDAIYVPGGADAAAVLATSGLTLSTLAEAYKHLKALALSEDAAALLLPKAGIEVGDAMANGVFIGDVKAVGKPFLAAIGEHRVWTRTNLEPVPA